MGWNVVPDGLREMLLWISNRYDNPLIYITENGAAFDEPDLAAAREADGHTHEGHLRARASHGTGVHLVFCWSLSITLMAILVRKRFGLYHVD
jgi:beta-glucosidase/6-phospho-beta-glucosidase/beta-galactosidase